METPTKQERKIRIRLPQWLMRLFRRKQVTTAHEADEVRYGTSKHGRARKHKSKRTTRRHVMIAKRHQRQAQRLANLQRV